MLIYRIISTDEEAGTSYSVWNNVIEKLKSSEKTKSTEGASFLTEKGAYKENNIQHFKLWSIHFTAEISVKIIK